MIVYVGSGSPSPELVDLRATMVLRSIARTPEDAADRRRHAPLPPMVSNCRTVLKLRLERIP